ncbi:MAG: amidohydrolase [Burkholderiales bacterium]
MRFKNSAGSMLALTLMLPALVLAQADVILQNGKIVTLDQKNSIRQAMAVRDGKIAAVGSNEEVKKLAGRGTRVIDLGGRTVIPGMIDSHLHGIRAGQTFGTEVNWIGATSIEEGLARIRGAARSKRAGEWIIVAGGWTEQQFKEKRRPTQAELIAAAPENPVYIQLFYQWVLLNPLGLKALNITNDADLTLGGKLERDAAGNLSGGIVGSAFAISAVFDRLPQPTLEQQAEGSRKFFRELNRLGLTGFADPGGRNVYAKDYQALYRVWQEKKLTVRIAYSIFSQNAGKELEEMQSLTQLLPMGMGDDMLRFIGIGEAVTLGMYNNDKPTDKDKEEFYRAAKWAAEKRMSLQIHWENDRSVGEALSVFERLNKEVPITNLRWFIAHLNNASEPTLRRMKDLGIGWAVQNATYYSADRYLKAEGPAGLARTPPIKTGLNVGVNIGMGTDAHRVASYNPMVALRWLIDGKSVWGMPTRNAEQLLSREEALRLYTLGSAWIVQDDARRGSLVPGKFADLAVLSKDYLTVPVDQISELESILTMVSGRVVFGSGRFSKFEN